MPREKIKRKLYFKPTFKEFIPKDTKPNGVSNLLHEEVEALYLMDILELYQEEAATKMEVSRPTFTRILKSARKKVSSALVSGYKIVIQDIEQNGIIAICSGSKEELTNIKPTQKYIHIYKQNKKRCELFKTIDNPAYNPDEKPAILLPPIFLQYNVNIFITSKLAVGLKNSLLTLGIETKIIDKEIKKEDLCSLI